MAIPPKRWENYILGAINFTIIPYRLHCNLSFSDACCTIFTAGVGDGDVSDMSLYLRFNILPVKENWKKVWEKEWTECLFVTDIQVKLLLGWESHRPSLQINNCVKWCYISSWKPHHNFLFTSLSEWAEHWIYMKWMDLKTGPKKKVNVIFMALLAHYTLPNIFLIYDFKECT